MAAASIQHLCQCCVCTVNKLLMTGAQVIRAHCSSGGRGSEIRCRKCHRTGLRLKVRMMARSLYGRVRREGRKREEEGEDGRERVGGREVGK